jgi:hypothetical protein
MAKDEHQHGEQEAGPDAPRGRRIVERTEDLIKIRISWGWWAAVCVGVVAVWLTVAHGLPYGHDSEFHIYRQTAWDALIRRGMLYTRWMPFLGYGYGFPLSNYYPPLLYYVAEPFRLLGLDALMALRLTLGLALVGAAAGMYAWVRDLFGPGPGVVAATAYVFSPYVMYTLINRAGFAEMAALAWMPWGVWALRRYAVERRLAYGVGSALIVAAMLLSHLFTAYLFIAGLLVYALALSWVIPGEKHPRYTQRLAAFLRLLWPIALGLGLAAFMWLPAMMESNLIQIERVLLIADPAKGDGLLPLIQVLGGPLLPNRTLPVAVVPPSLSGVAIVLALVGLVAGWVALRSRELKGHLLVALGITVVAVGMVTPAGGWLWRVVPLLRLSNLPHRFLSAGSLWLALLTGAGTAALLALLAPTERLAQSKKKRSPTSPRPWRPLAATSIVTGACLALSLYALGWPGVAIHPPDLRTDLEATLRFEREAGALGLITASEYLPKTVRQHPAAVAGPGPADPRLDIASLPEGARVVDERYDWFAYHVTFESLVPFRAVFKTFDFPGWQATINRRAVPILPTDPYGLISLDVPAGQSQIAVRFGTTPARAFATGLSVVSALVTGSLAAWAARPKARSKGDAMHDTKC